MLTFLSWRLPDMQEMVKLAIVIQAIIFTFFFLTVLLKNLKNSLLQIVKQCSISGKTLVSGSERFKHSWAINFSTWTTTTIFFSLCWRNHLNLYVKHFPALASVFALASHQWVNPAFLIVNNWISFKSWCLFFNQSHKYKLWEFVLSREGEASENSIC